MTTSRADGIVRIYQGEHVVGFGAGTAEFEVVQDRIRIVVHDAVRFAQATFEASADAVLAALCAPSSARPLEGAVSWSRMGISNNGQGRLYVNLGEEDSRDVVAIVVQLGEWALGVRIPRAVLGVALADLGRTTALGGSAVPVVDLGALAAAALADVDRTMPEAAHLVHEQRIESATAQVVDQDPGAYFNQIVDAIRAVAGPCPCSRCR